MTPVLPPIDSALFKGEAICQICWVVPDLDAAIERWRDIFGIGPWVTMDNAMTVGRTYRGQPTTLEYKAALAWSGEMQVELIQQLTDEPSCYRDVVPAGKTGLHHIAITVADYAGERARLAALGYDMAFEAQLEDFHFGYVDTTATLGIMTELLEDKPMLQQMRHMERALSAQWDGVTRPVRTIAEVMADMAG